MARLNITFLLRDPDLSTTVEMIKRTSTLVKGVNTVTDSDPVTYRAVVQGVGTEDLKRVPEGAQYSDLKKIYIKEYITAQRGKDGYSDVFIIDGNRYEVLSVDDFMSYNRNNGHCEGILGFIGVSNANIRG